MFFRHRRRRFFGFIIVALLLLGLCGLLSSTAYQSGWSQGFDSGQVADGPPAENVTSSPFNGGAGFPGIFSIFWWGLAAFFKFWLLLFFFGLIFKFLFWGRRGRHYRGRPFGPWGGGPWGGGHDRQGRHHHEGHHEKGEDYKGQRPPWFDDSDGEPVMKA